MLTAGLLSTYNLNPMLRWASVGFRRVNPLRMKSSFRTGRVVVGAVWKDKRENSSLCNVLKGKQREEAVVPPMLAVVHKPSPSYLEDVDLDSSNTQHNHSCGDWRNDSGREDGGNRYLKMQ